MGLVLLLSILIKKDLGDIQKVQIKETIEKNIVDKVEDDKRKIKNIRKKFQYRRGTLEIY
jgi:hypothetical protein